MKKKQEKQETKKERKMRYLNETAVQIEILKWLALFATLAVYDMNAISKLCLGIIFIVDLGATKYVMEDLALKILMITLILSAFIADMTIMNASFITELCRFVKHMRHSLVLKGFIAILLFFCC